MKAKLLFKCHKPLWLIFFLMQSLLDNNTHFCNFAYIGSFPIIGLKYFMKKRINWYFPICRKFWQLSVKYTADKLTFVIYSTKNLTLLNIITRKRIKLNSYNKSFVIFSAWFASLSVGLCHQHIVRMLYLMTLATMKVAHLYQNCILMAMYRIIYSMLQC